ncbi:MAG: class I SAM-dependent methyltransferase [Nitrospinales bacterium]
MKTEWDYTDLAEAYLKRPDYSDSAIDDMLSCAGISSENNVCDVGAGVAHLTIKLAERKLNVTSVEPNDAMRKRGIARTKKFPNVQWFEGTGENTGQADTTFDMVTFGSSFNVTDRQKALLETSRILKPRGWFACMWNHRNLEDPLQASIEGAIKSHLADYDYGTRREDQEPIIQKSGLFEGSKKIEGEVIQKQTIEDCANAWRSHATLHRQAGDKFDSIIKDIEKILSEIDGNEIAIPYITRIWVAQLKK